MKSIPGQVAQGDVLLTPVDQLPAGRLRILPRDGGRVILAYGEVTGHAHAIIDRDVDLLVDDETNRRFLRIMNASGATLKHEEHGAIALTSTLYEVGGNDVGTQREYTPTEIVRVAD